MLKKLILLGLLVIVCFSIKQRSEKHLTNDHNLFGIGGPKNPKNRSEQEVCEHYGGKMCTVFRIGSKCCKDGWIFKNTHCGGVGCEHDTLSISDKDWNY